MIEPCIGREFLRVASQFPERVMLRYPNLDQETRIPQAPRELRYRQVKELVLKCAHYLIRHIEEAGNEEALLPIMVLGGNCPESFVLLLGSLLAGIPITIPNIDDPYSVGKILSQQQFSIIFTENQEQMNRVPEEFHHLIQSYSLLEDLPEPDSMSLSSFESQLRQKALAKESVALLPFTSGSSGRPKGVKITQHALAVATSHLADTGVFPEGREVLLILHLSHIYPVMAALTCIVTMCPVIIPGPRQERALQYRELMLQAVKFGDASLLFLVPRLLVNIAASVRRTIAHLNQPKRFFAQAVLDIGRAYSVGMAIRDARKYGVDPASIGIPDHRPLPFWLTWLFFLLLAPVRSTIVRNIFGRPDVIIGTGGSACSVETILFFRGLGIEVLQGYGSTEANITNVTVPGAPNFPGSVGILIGSDIEVLIDENRVLWIHYPGMMEGYLDNAMTTEVIRTISGKRYYCTGDIVNVITAASNDHSGNSFDVYYIIGREGRMYNLQTGKKVYPEITEQLLTTHRLIEHALLYGDDSRPYNIALVSLDQVQAGHLDQFSREPAQLEVLLASIIDEINQKLPPEQKAGKWRIVEISQANELVTATRKVRYSKVIERYWVEIEEMYKDQRKGS